MICFARNKYALRDLHRQFRSKRIGVYKRYIAQISGHLETFDGEIDLPIDRDRDRGPPFCKFVFFGQVFYLKRSRRKNNAVLFF